MKWQSDLLDHFEIASNIPSNKELIASIYDCIWKSPNWKTLEICRPIENPHMGLKKSSDQKLPNKIPLTNELLYCLCLWCGFQFLSSSHNFLPLPCPFCSSLIKEISFNSLYIDKSIVMLSLFVYDVASNSFHLQTNFFTIPFLFVIHWLKKPLLTVVFNLPVPWNACGLQLIRSDL